MDSTGAPAESPIEAPPRSTTHIHHVRLTAMHAPHVVSPGVIYDGWTFNGVIPAPVIRLTVGDSMDFTLVNGAPIPHSMDFHAAQIAPSRAYINVMPKDSIHFGFIARVPGVFLYHCGTAPVAAHISAGMYGALIVDPVVPRAPAREFVIVQSEFYLNTPIDSTAHRTMAWQKMLNLSPDYVVFNGVAGQYAARPVDVKAHELLRFYVVDAGPNRVSSFHVVGALFDRVYQDGFGAPLQGVQTAGVPVGGGMIFETRLAEPGLYPFVTHAFGDATKGAVGILRAGPGKAS